MVADNDVRLYQSIQAQQRKRSRKIGCKGLDERLHTLKQLKKLVADNESKWLHALEKDLGKPAVEAYASEIGVLLNEIEHVTKNLKKWLRPKTKQRLLLSGKDKVVVSHYPYGSILVLAPWNYPLQLALMPVIGALAGGNGVVLKPSEFATETSALLAELVPLYFSNDILFVAEGDDTVAATLTQMAWDFIFFTGSPQTGTKVYEAAAKKMTPVLLELGGKNPCILDETGITDAAIKQIAWGKFLNAGQSCIAPDTVYVPRAHLQSFLKKIQAHIEAFYGENPLQSPDYGRLIHEKHFQRILEFLQDGTVYYGGEYAKEALKLAPTLLIDIKADSAVTKEEIFGPILPVIPYDTLDELKVQLRQMPVPLCVYVFSTRKETIHELERDLESGAFSINQVMFHAVNPFLPFGGKGKSGLGRYHGQSSFQAFTYQRANFTKKMPFTLAQQFPPYTQTAQKALRKLRKKIF